MKHHNAYYHNNTIDESVLSRLPLDSDIATVPMMVDESIMPETQSTQEHLNEGLLAGIVVPILPKQTTEEERIRRGINGTNVLWPHINQSLLRGIHVCP